MLELTAGTLGQGVGGHDALGGLRPVVDTEVGQRGGQGALDLLDRQRLADHPGGERQHRALGHPGQLGELGAGAAGADQAVRAGAGVGVAGVGQQIANLASQALTGDQHRRGAEGVGGGHAGDGRTLGTAHHHHVLAPDALDAGRGDTEFEAGNRVQGGQGAKTDSHGKAP
ncbi:hypothetical protein D3C84_609310 [compost metagenome]